MLQLSFLQEYKDKVFHLSLNQNRSTFNFFFEKLVVSCVVSQPAKSDYCENFHHF